MNWFFKDTFSWFDFICIILCFMALVQGNFVVVALTCIVGGIISSRVQKMIGVRGSENVS